MAQFLFPLAKTAQAYFYFSESPVCLSLPLKPVPFRKLFASLGSTSKSAISLLFSFSLILARSLPLCSWSFLLPQTPRQIWQELSCLSSFTIRLQWVLGHSFLQENDAADELARRGALLLPLLHSWTAGVLSHLNPLTKQIPSVSTEKLLLPRHARCILSRLRCHG